MNNNSYEVVIIGGGVCGAALLYVLSNYTNVKRIALIEKEADIALVNSFTNSNSQTLHFGDIETNYTLAKAEKVKAGASLVKNYLLTKDPHQEIYTKYHKMVLGVGKEQEQLKTRYQQFKTLFPDLKLLERAEIASKEPKVLLNRPEDQEIIALYTDEGYTVDFNRLAKSFVANALENTETTIDLLFNTKVKQISKQAGEYQLKTSDQTITSKVIMVAAGAHSLLFAKSLGYGLNYALLSVAGSFYFAPQFLNGKVYTVQQEKLPFAAIHGDPEVHDRAIARFGPTAKVLPMLERHHYGSIIEYFQTAGLSLKALLSFAKILSDPIIFKYIALNFVYDFPIIGKRLFIKEVSKIIPSVKLTDLTYAKGYGGVRPQVVNLNTQALEMGEAKITGDRIIFNITPSPGASTCLQNALEDTTKLIDFLGSGYRFERQQFLDDLSVNSEQLLTPNS
ncbi:FAD-dependent oxidoreductase [Pleurocapsa sp. CCALA 161]|uniref:FAD-dependent oxidoreductase n=1 Tax=Pleurocapsa sp. CCALA 161 TaxID=2107688 RepID=UPI000D0796CF|nr:FAD-dependent oxidoreductase [Pleurocapsa sp. CCALA 161]PSB12423.1 FAD-dependent oxidoreductase [Pleurocapsa sp. CCALA 161]